MAINDDEQAMSAGARVEQSMDGRLPASNSQATVDPMRKYGEERAKRLKPEGVSQYIDLSSSGNFKRFQDDPWVDFNAPGVKNPALKDGSRCKYLILGAGYGGLLFAVRLIQAGVKASEIRIVDSAGGFGGTWYWNRYPGLMCDVESYVYMPLLEEMGYMPKHKYSYGPELLGYANEIADKYRLRDQAAFRMETTELTWDEGANEWIVKLAHGRTSLNQGSDLTVRSQFVIAAGGLLNNPQIPGISGISSFQGHAFHTCRWDYAYTGGSPTDPSLANLVDKKVGIIGTGATAVQAVPHLAKWAKELYVFQRTPSAVDERQNKPTEPEWWAKQLSSQPGWQRLRAENFNAHVSNAPSAVDLIGDGWSRCPSFSAQIGGPKAANLAREQIPTYVGSLHAMDLPRQQRIRARVDEIVQDRATAEKLKAWYPGWCKRPCFHDEYLPAFNLPQVHLVDTDGKGVDHVTPTGLVANGTAYELDLLVFSTGFRSPAVGSPAARMDMSVTGRHGRSLDQKWADGVSTLHGVVSRDFPNLFWPGPLQAGATANQMFVLARLSEHVAYIISTAQQRRDEENVAVSIEPTEEAEEEWSMRILAGSAGLAALVGCTPGYLNREGELDKVVEMGPEAQMKAGRGGIWGAGIADFLHVIEAWRKEGGMKGLDVKVSS